MTKYERAYWLADMIQAYGDYAKEAGELLKKQADEIERLRKTLAGISEADYRVRDENVGPEVFVAWAKSRATHALKGDE